MSKDWTGNTHSTFVTIGASNHTDNEREINDYYATDPHAVEVLLQVEDFQKLIWECACGEGHISKVLESAGHIVFSTDLVDRGYSHFNNIDFLKYDDKFDGDIITNPPYKYATEFVKKALDITSDGSKVAMLLKLTFLEGIKRRKLFDDNPPKTVYVFSKRIKCAINGDFEHTGQSAMAYAWFVWQKGYKGDTVIKWVN
jgi:hypothetical protein